MLKKKFSDYKLQDAKDQQLRIPGKELMSKKILKTMESPTVEQLEAQRKGIMRTEKSNGQSVKRSDNSFDQQANRTLMASCKSN